MTVGGSAIQFRSLLNRSIGGKVAATRRRMSQSKQSDLATMIGVSRAAISALESGVQGISVSTLCKIAHALNVDPGVLLPDRSEIDEILRASNHLKPNSAVDAVDQFLKEAGFEHSNGE